MWRVATGSCYSTHAVPGSGAAEMPCRCALLTLALLAPSPRGQLLAAAAPSTIRVRTDKFFT